MNVFQSSWARLSILFVLLQLSSVGIIVFGVYWITATYIDQRTATQLATEIEILSTEYDERGISGLIEMISRRTSSDFNSLIYLLIDRRDEVLAGNLSHWPPGLIVDRQPALLDILAPGAGQSVPISVMAFGLPEGRLLVGQDRRERVELRRRIELSLLYGVGVTFVLGVLGGIWFSRRALRRVDAINQTTARIIDGDLTGRVPLSASGDEIDRLAINLNRMLDRISSLMTEMRQVTDSVAHDLRTPLTRLRARLEAAVKSTTLQSDLQNHLLAGVEECDHLLEIFRALLSISEVEAAGGVISFTLVSLDEVANGAIELYEPLAEASRVTITLEAASIPTKIIGHRQLLAQALANLVDNAIKFTPEGGSVVIEVGRDSDGRPTLVVADTGPGVPIQERERILNRFVRLDNSRATPGHGLGLALVDAVARRHGARLVLEDHHPGLRVTLTFPDTATTGSFRL